MRKRTLISNCNRDYYRNLTIGIFELIYFVVGFGLVVYGTYLSV